MNTGVFKTILKEAYVTYLKFKPVFKKNKKIKNRRYIHPKLGVEGFLKDISDLDYVVLRWFENLPYLEHGEDIDILISDKDLGKINKFLNGIKGQGIPCDIYTCGGLPGTDYKKVPYFPVKIADNIIKNSVVHNGIVKVPDKVHHLLTMIYHILYHKGFDSGIPSQYELPASCKKPDHNYLEIVQDLAGKNKINIPAKITLENLDTFLNKNKWRPSKDTLKKLSKRNEWIEKHFFSSKEEIASHWNGFTTFIIRERGVPFLHEIKNFLWDDGFEIIYEGKIPENIRELSSPDIRGGNWNRGPYPTSGGKMAYVIATYDLHPREVKKYLAEKYPGITNARIAKTKTVIRSRINKFFKNEERCNVIHSADNPYDSLEYASQLIPDKINLIEKKIKRLRNEFKTPFPVIKDLSKKSRRAKVEIVNYMSKEAIYKTFRPGRERFMEREILARKLKGDLSSISEILETGKNYIILKKYKDILYKKSLLKQPFRNEKYMPLPVIKEVRKILSHYRSQGYELIDILPSNFLYDEKEGLKVLDFEFMQKGKVKTSKLKGCYAWYGIPDDFQGDKPQGRIFHNPYRSKWFVHTGLPRFLCLYNIPDPVLHIIRLFLLVIISLYIVVKKVISKSIKVPAIILKKIKTRIKTFLINP